MSKLNNYVRYVLFLALTLLSLDVTHVQAADEVDVKWARERLIAGALLVDVRDSAEYYKSHVGGAVSVPYDRVQKSLASFGKDKYRDIVIYGPDGKIVQRVIQLLRKNGYTTLHNGGSYKEFLQIENERDQEEENADRQLPQR